MNVDKSDNSVFDLREYRDALGCFATGVCLISTLDSEGRPRAMTANSFSSVSLDPPMILWCIDEKSARFDLFCRAEHFGVNMLRAGEEAASREFAKNVEAVIPAGDLVRGKEGIPLYRNALGFLECRTAWRQKAGDHVVIFAHVLGYGSHDGNALGFFKGGYAPVSLQED